MDLDIRGAETPLHARGLKGVVTRWTDERKPGQRATAPKVDLYLRRATDLLKQT